MSIKVKILRQRTPVSEPYWEGFVYDGPDNNTIAGLLTLLNYNDDIVNDAGENVPRISWECSCLQASCGSCAMVINGRPALACETFIKDLKGDAITIEPLRKFPTVCDLVVDRSSIQQNLLKTNAYIKSYNPKEKESHEHQYTAAKCLKCGLCLEVCPNYTGEGKFYGALFANDSYLICARNKEQSEEMHGIYDEHFARGCSKSLSCMEVCPMSIPTIASMAKMNRNKK